MRRAEHLYARIVVDSCKRLILTGSEEIRVAISPNSVPTRSSGGIGDNIRIELTIFRRLFILTIDGNACR